MLQEERSHAVLAARNEFCDVGNATVCGCYREELCVGRQELREKRETSVMH